MIFYQDERHLRLASSLAFVSRLAEETAEGACAVHLPFRSDGLNIQLPTRAARFGLRILAQEETHMKRLLLGTAVAIGMSMVGAAFTPAAARVDFSFGVGPFVIDSEHDRCYDYWFRVRHPRFCYYGDYDEDWWDHHHHGWDRRHD